MNTLLDILLKFIEKDKINPEDVLLSIYNQLTSGNSKKLTTAQRAYVYAKMSLLFNLTQQFLTLIALQKCEKTKADFLQQQFLERRQYRPYQKFIRAQEKFLKSMVKDADYFEYQFILENSRLDFAQRFGKLSKDGNFNIVKNSLTQYFLLYQLNFYLIELSLKEVDGSYKIERSHYEALEGLLKLSQFTNNRLLSIYQSFIRLMENKTETAFFKLIEELDVYEEELSSDSQIDFYNTLINFCMLEIRKKNEAYNNHQLNLYKKMDTKNLLLIENQTHLSNLHNIVSVSCKAKQFDWAVEMIEKYYDYLPVKIRDAIKNYNLGAIAYHKMDYQLAIDYLFPLPNINQTYDVNRRSIMIKSFYELDSNYKETTHTLFRSFEKYIREHKSLTSKSKTSYKNFIRTLINLYRIKHSVTKMKLDNVQRKLEAQQLNSNKSWLLEKIEELR